MKRVLGINLSDLFGGKAKYISKRDLKEGSADIKIYNPESNSVPEALGIRDGRADELIEVCKNSFTNTEKLTEAIEEAGKQCKHINELIFCTNMITKHQVEIQPRKSRMPENPTSMQILRISENGSLGDGLGILKERAKELADMAYDKYKNSKDLIEVMEAISPECKHPNELFFMTWVVSDVHRKNNSLGGLLEALKGESGD